MTPAHMTKLNPPTIFVVFLVFPDETSKVPSTGGVQSPQERVARPGEVYFGRGKLMGRNRKLNKLGQGCLQQLVCLDEGSNGKRS